MADDLAAEITLRLRAQMSGPIDEIRKLFKSLNDTVKSLDKTVKDLAVKLDTLSISDQPLRQMKALQKEMLDVTGTARDTGKAVRDIGMGAGAGVRGERAAAARGVEGPKNAGDSVDWLGGAIAGAVGLGTITALGDYQKVLRQIAITEKLKGPKADAEVGRLGTMFNSLALKDRQSSMGLAQAYWWMITTHMPRSVVRKIMPDIGMMATAHNLQPIAVSDAAFALNSSFKIGPKGMLGALEMLATAAKQAHFTMENFGQYLKEIGGVSETMGLTGRGNADMVAAGLETVVKNATQPNQAAADYRDFLVYLNSPQFNMAGARLGFKKRIEASQWLFDKYHIRPVSFWRLEDQAKAHGQNEVSYMLNYFHRITAKMTPGDRAKYLRTVFGNQQSAQTVQSILLHWKSYQETIKLLGGVSSKTGAQDFATALKGANTSVDRFHEEIKQLERDIGQGLLPALKGVNVGLNLFLKGINGLNKVEIPVLKTGLGDLAVGAAGAYGTLKAFGALRGRVIGSRTKGAGKGGGADSPLDDVVDAAKRGVEAAPEGAEGGPWGVLGAVIAAAIGSKIEDSLSKSIKQAGADVGDLLVHALGGHVVDVNVKNAHELGSIPLPPPPPPSLPRATPPRGPFLNRP